MKKLIIALSALSLLAGVSAASAHGGGGGGYAGVPASVVTGGHTKPVKAPPARGPFGWVIVSVQDELPGAWVCDPNYGYRGPYQCGGGN